VCVMSVCGVCWDGVGVGVGRGYGGFGGLTGGWKLGLGQ